MIATTMTPMMIQMSVAVSTGPLLRLWIAPGGRTLSFEATAPRRAPQRLARDRGVGYAGRCRPTEAVTSRRSARDSRGGKSGCRGPFGDPRRELRQVVGPMQRLEELLVGHDAAGAPQEAGAHDHLGVHLAVHHRPVHQVRGLVVVAQQARLDREALPQLERLAERDRLARDDGVPALLLEHIPDAGADQQIESPEVEQRPVAAVVHVARAGRCRSAGCAPAPARRPSVRACPCGAAAPWRARSSGGFARSHSREAMVAIRHPIRRFRCARRQRRPAASVRLFADRVKPFRRFPSPQGRA